jgi:DNA-directed RNA polymerase specialized sigma24 family protein
MVVVKTVEEFYKKNHNDLKSFMMFKTGITDTDLINDTLQEFYLRLVGHNILDTYDDKRAPNEKENKQNFESWIMYRLCWVFTYMKKKEEKEEHYNSISQVEDIEDSSVKDIWEVIDTTKRNKFFTVNKDYHASLMEQEDENSVNKHLNSFLRHIEKRLPEKRAGEIKKYMLYKAQGLNNVDIAACMGMSSTMVNFIKEDAARRYKSWKKHQVTV